MRIPNILRSYKDVDLIKFDPQHRKALHVLAMLLSVLVLVSLVSFFFSWARFLTLPLLLLSIVPTAVLGLAIFDLTIKNQELIESNGADTHAAMHDPLTGLANRRNFEKRLGDLVAEDAPKHVLMMLDLDRFKPVNDLHGHAAGDALLKEISAGLTKIVSPQDMVARLGGDEFAIILTTTNRQVANALTLRTLEFVTKFRLNWKGSRIRVGTSIGLVNIDKAGLDPATLLALADDALYAAKQAGRGAAFIAVPATDASNQPTFECVDSVTAVQDVSAASHEPVDGRQQKLFGTIVASLDLEKTETDEHRQGSRIRHKVQTWIMTEPRTLGDESGPGMDIRELMEDASSRADGGANLARWILANALNAASQMTASEIDQTGFVLPIPAEAITTVSSLGEDLMRMNALAHSPLRHITFLIHNINSIYRAPELLSFSERLASSDAGIAFEVRSSTMDALAPLHYLKYNEMYLSSELSRNLHPGSSGYAAIETLLIAAEHADTTVVAAGVDTAEELRHLGQLGVNRFSGPVVGGPRPLHELIQDMKSKSNALQQTPQLRTGT